MAVTKVIRKPLVEVEAPLPGLPQPPRNVVNHAVRGDSRRPMTKFEKDAEKMSPEELRAEADKQLKGDHWKNEIGPQVADRISAVLARYKPMGYRDSVENARAIAAKLSTAEAIQERRRQHREDNDYSLLEIAGAVEAVIAEGHDINEAAASKQRIETYSEQLASVPRSEADLETMPMHQLRALADGRFDPLGPK